MKTTQHLVATFSLALFIGSAATVQAEDYTYITNNGTITITGYTGLGGDVTIPDVINSLPVTTIGYRAFTSQRGLTSVTIPNTVTSIGEQAFSYCGSLTSITIGTNVTTIGEGAFSNCSSLANVTIPNSVTRIACWAFYYCTSLTSITIPNSVNSIGGFAFAYGTSLTTITVDPNNGFYTSLEGVLFDKNTNTLVQCPGGKGGSYTIPPSVTCIGDFAFESCTNLTNVTIPNSVTNIGYAVFWSCTSLATITVDPNNGFYTSLEGVLFDKNTNTLMQCPRGKGGSYTIPESVTTIQVGAFSNCGSLTSVRLPHGVTNIGYAEFRGCASLTAITVDPRNGYYSSVEGVLFDKSTNTLMQCPRGKGGGYTIPDSVTIIGIFAFWECDSLTSVTIPDSVTTIPSGTLGMGTFSGCTSLTTATIGNGVTSIGDFAFAYCTNLTRVTIGNNVTNIGVWAFVSCPSLTSITIPDGVTTIAVGAFDGCTSLTSVYFAGNAPSLGGGAVYDAPATIFYLPGTTGWDVTFGGCPTAPWHLPYPTILTTPPNFGIQTNAFGFRISWATNASVVVEASATLANPVWSPVSTNTLTDGWSDFSDAGWVNHPARFYRVRQR